MIFLQGFAKKLVAFFVVVWAWGLAQREMPGTNCQKAIQPLGTSNSEVQMKDMSDSAMILDPKTGHFFSKLQRWTYRILREIPKELVIFPIFCCVHSAFDATKHQRFNVLKSTRLWSEKNAGANPEEAASRLQNAPEAGWKGFWSLRNVPMTLY